MLERRKLERFQFATPTRVLAGSPSDARTEYDLTIRDLSSDGAFLYSTHILPKGTTVKMEFVLALEPLRKLTTEKGRARVRVRGTVIRSEARGIAIRFSGNYKITALGADGTRGGGG